MLTTHRLTLRELDDADADFIVALLNDSAFLEFIGDRGVRTAADARGYIARVRESYATHGFGLYAVCPHGQPPVGLCGLVRRATLPLPDVGFAFLPAARRLGYGRESVQAVLTQANDLGLHALLAICSPENTGSRRLLERVGFRYEQTVVLPGETRQTCWYARPSAVLFLSNPAD